MNKSQQLSIKQTVGGRILVVEDDPDQRKDLCITLEMSGYKPVVAEGTGDVLISHAGELAKTECCQVALVDVRLFHNNDEHDESGLDVIQKVAPARSIVVTAYPNLSVASQAFREKGAFDVVGKEENPQKLLQAIQAALDDHLKHDINIIYKDRMGNLKGKDKFDADRLLSALGIPSSSNSHEELHSVIAHLLAGDGNKSRISTITISIPSKQNFAFLPIGMYSLTFVAQATDAEGISHQAQLIRIFRRSGPSDELRNYRLFVSPALPPQRIAHIEIQKSVEYWELGGVAYVAPTKDIEPFSSFFLSNNADRSIRLIEKIFDGVYKDQFLKSAYNSNESKNLIRLYLGGFEELSTVRQLSSEGIQNLLPIKLTNPLDWVHSRESERPVTTTRLGVVHGNLTTQNIMVDENGNPFLIDFERSGLDHALRDFITLELDIATKLTRLPHVQPQLFLELALAMTYSNDFRVTLPTTHGLLNNVDTRRAVAVIQAIREKALQITGYKDHREYLWGLLLEAISMLEREGQSEIQQRLAVLASLICIRLENWHSKVWPPPGIPSSTLTWSDEEAQDQVELRIRGLKARLRILEAQKTSYGSDIPRDLVSNIDQTRKEIEKFGVTNYE